MPMISYAQNREDVILARAFGGTKGFYVDVGAAHPVCHSVTKWFYEQGWTGLNIEPLPQFFNLIVQDRPRDINVNMVASDAGGECVFFEVPGSCGTSTVNPILAEQIAQSGAKLVQHTVQCRTLRDLCEEHVGDRTIDFLKIDAEGHERAVLLGADFKRWRPRALVIETTNVESWEGLVIDAEYKLVLFDGLNRYYVRHDEPDLMTRMAAPANCLDDYIPHEYAVRIEQLERELKAARSQVVHSPLPLSEGMGDCSSRTGINPPVKVREEERIEAVSSRFFDHGCEPVKWYKKPVAQTRRLLRRVQRPFFFSLQSTLDTMQHEIRKLRAAADIAKCRNEELSAQVETLMNSQCLHPQGLSVALDELEWKTRAVATPHHADRPYRVLFVVSSGSQMYSGIGRAIFELTRRTLGPIRYEFAVDDGNERNVETLSRFCSEHCIPLHIGAAGDGTGDPGNRDLPDLLHRGGWDAVECVSFANSATNGSILKHASHLPILYTPHYQPMWTIPVTPEWARQIESVHGELLRRAAVVACDSPWEWLLHRSGAGPGVDCVLLPLGFNPEDFTPGPRSRRPYLLFVGDLVEKRKRFPLVLEVFEAVLNRHPGLQLVVVGNKSDELAGRIPASIMPHCVLMGYVAENDLRNLYRNAAGLMQLSDYEAFGLPILESLACGTPVFLSRRPTVTGAFGRYRGAVFIDDAAPSQMAETISRTLEQGSDFIDQVLTDRGRLIAELSWETLASKRLQILNATLTVRNGKIRTAA